MKQFKRANPEKVLSKNVSQSLFCLNERFQFADKKIQSGLSSWELDQIKNDF